MNITVADCRHVVGMYYRIPKEIMCSRTRKRKIVRPRQMAMTLARELTMASFPKIASHFGLGDHTTAIHAVNRIYEMERANHPRVRSAMDDFRLVFATFKAQQAVTLLEDAP